ncbi:MAG: energy transducer TonB [Myxococcota bacterium]
MVSAVRIPTAAFIAAAVTFFLFRLMSYLIFMTEMSLDEDKGRTRIEFVRAKNDSNAQTKTRELPVRQKPKTPPKTPEMDRSADANANASGIAVATPQIDAGLNLDGALQLGARPTDSEEVPVVRVEPIYPRRAAEQFIEGWVVLQFDITTTGATSNVKVIDAQPKRIFDRAAARAVSKWKYRPKIIDGKALVTKGIKVRLTFKLD